MFNVFLLTTFSGSLFEELGIPLELCTSRMAMVADACLAYQSHLLVLACSGELLESPKTLPDVLARTLPSQSNFFLSYILINGLSSWTIALGHFGSAFKFILCKRPFEPDLTKKGVGIEGKVDYSSVAPKLLLVFLLAINFAIIAPIILLPAAGSCATIYVVHKYLFLYVRFLYIWSRLWTFY